MGSLGIRHIDVGSRLVVFSMSNLATNYNTWQYRTHSTCQEPRCCPPDTLEGTTMNSYPESKPVILRECDIARFESWSRGSGVSETAPAAASDSLALRLALATHQGRSGQTSIPCDRSDRVTSCTAAVSDQRTAPVYSKPPRHSEIALFSGLGNQRSDEACRHAIHGTDMRPGVDGFPSVLSTAARQWTPHAHPQLPQAHSRSLRVASREVGCWARSR